VVEVEHGPPCVPRATAVAAAEAIALEDQEAKLVGEGMTGQVIGAAGQGAFPTRRVWVDMGAVRTLGLSCSRWRGCPGVPKITVVKFSTHPEHR
jgi:hypothetical protein